MIGHAFEWTARLRHVARVSVVVFVGAVAAARAPGVALAARAPEADAEMEKPSTAPAADPAADEQRARVKEAIRTATAWLLDHQRDGNWEETRQPVVTQPINGAGPNPATFWGGRTALVTYALLSAGHSPDDAGVARAIRWLSGATLKGTYAVALRGQVWQFLPESKERNAARDRDRDLLLSFMLPTGMGTGFYGYAAPGAKETWYDRSNSQFAVLGMSGVEQAGADVPAKYWEVVDKAWRSAQQDGSWTYTHFDVDNNTAAITAAGLATLAITRDHLLRAGRWDVPRPNAGDPNVDAAADFLRAHADTVLRAMGANARNANAGNGNPFAAVARPAVSVDTYAAFVLTRAGVATGRRDLTPDGWAHDVTTALLAGQGSDGSWTQKWGAVPDTGLALLCLSIVDRPVTLAKLEYGPHGPEGASPFGPPRRATKSPARRNERPGTVWDQRPNDAGHLTDYLARVLGRPCRWEVTNLGDRGGAPGFDAAMLYVSGSGDLVLDPTERERVRAFVAAGGMVLGNADGGKAAFAKSFQALATELFPGKSFRELPEDHPMLTLARFGGGKWKVRPKVLALGDERREWVLLIPEADPAKAWQLGPGKAREEMFQLGSNILLYAEAMKQTVDPRARRTAPATTRP